MALLDPTINLMTKYSTYVQNPITFQNIIKHIPVSIETRLSDLSCSEIIFKESATHYEDNLRQSGSNKKLIYKPADTNHQKHSKHKRKMICFNLAFNKNVSSKIGKSFLSLFVGLF